MFDTINSFFYNKNVKKCEEANNSQKINCKESTWLLFFSPLPTPVCLEKVSDDGGGDDGDGGDEEERDKLEDVEVGLLRKLDKFRHVFRRHLVTSYVI